MSVIWDEFVPTARARHVVVIEDEPVVRMLLEEFLAEIGFSSASFDNAVPGLTHLVRVQGDCCLIIADQGLPGGIQGIEFICLVNERWPNAAQAPPKLLLEWALAKILDASYTTLSLPHNISTFVGRL